MRKIISMTLLLLFLFGTNSDAAAQSTMKEPFPFEKVLLSLMFEDIHKAVNENYDFEGVQFYRGRVLYLKMEGGLSFIITIQIETFIGAHNDIGTDTLTFKRDVNGLKLTDYKHAASPQQKQNLEWYFKNSDNS
ncbi:DUF3888 domain-containing protein [Pullulanibacillus sp. KACC 23026]|uniref:DUF3888 domain-containing protein n=1 Tax=Pullulanibacillus sp. KACC 23026 TaxID=3028315 RepID=UPI0023B0E9FB|nr:DUF3888 domain-containing protein [Pullulanibacillus sp. KACC 23026]WEG14419.1 DUF3888 domain-containing protein [Pullulanibacillus sp. KACC 23026]